MLESVANEFDQIIAEASAKCELLREGQSREECCKEKGITNCPPIQNSSHSQNQVLPFIAVGSGFLIVCVLVYLILRKRCLQRSYGSLSKSTKATIVAWTIWIFVTISYVLLLEPYGFYIDDDELRNLFLWFILPPLSVLAIFYWIKRFTGIRKS